MAQDPEKKRLYMLEWRANNREHLKAYDRERYWSDPEAHRQKTRDHRAATGNLMNERTQRWRDNNPEKVKAYTFQEYWKCPEAKRQVFHDRMAKEPDRVREIRRLSARKMHSTTGMKNSRHYRARKKGAAGQFTCAQIDAILVAQGEGCAYCDSPVDLQLDHCIPLSRGGSNWPWNLQWLCAHHNISKRAKTDAEYRAQIGLPATPWISLQIWSAALLVPIDVLIPGHV